MSKYIEPTANNYPGLDRGFNQRFKLDSDLSIDKGEGVYLVSSAQDIINALVDIGKHDPLPGEIRMISGGHCYENFTFQSATDTHSGSRTRFVIDLSNMRGIREETVDGKDYIVVEPGASNWLIQQTLHSLYGAALPGGSCYSVCAGGHVSGGGYGLLSRLHGLTVDYLAGVEMVIPATKGTGYTIRPFTQLDADELNWACRGGGAGHFGVITKYYFDKTRVPSAPERALFITLPVSWKQFIDTDTVGEGVANFDSFMKAYYTACSLLPAQAFTLGKFTCATNAKPDTSDIMSIGMQVVYGKSSGHDASVLGGKQIDAILTKKDALAVIESFCSRLEQWIDKPAKSSFHKQTFQLKGHPVAATVSLDTVYDLPWIDMTQFLNGSGENQNGKYKSSYIKANFNTKETAAMYAFLTDTQEGNPAPAAADKTQTLIQIDSYGLQINQMDTIDETSGLPMNTAIAARASVLKTQYQTYWKDRGTEAKGHEKEIVDWMNAGYSYIHNEAQEGSSGFPLWGDKYQGCYFNYPDRQIGVNAGYKLDNENAEQYGDFLALYFGDKVAEKLRTIKAQVDPANIFSYAQSVSND